MKLIPDVIAIKDNVYKIRNSNSKLETTATLGYLCN